MQHGGSAAEAKRGNGESQRSQNGRKKGAIEQAYTAGQAGKLSVWCEDEAGPYQAIPHPGASWQPQGHPARQPHEWLRGGTAKLITLFHPATGELRAEGAERTTNAVLHPWLKGQLSEILADLALTPDAEVDAVRQWSTWGFTEEEVALMGAPPFIRMALVWDNLAGHYSFDIVRWCNEQGILLLYTPIGGSWLNMAESVQRIVVRRALAGQHPQTGGEVIEALNASVVGWNAAPTGFVWGGKRAQRRERARQRRHALGGSGACSLRPIRRQPRPSLYHKLLNVHGHDK